MNYEFSAIRESEIPRAAVPLMQHAIDTYASEINKVFATWAQFGENEMEYRPHAKSATVRDIMKHELLSQRRFFAEFLGAPEPPANEVLPPSGYGARLVEMARPRLEFLARQPESWWLAPSRFFDAERQRVWIFWRRILHTAHHRTQLTVYLRLLNKTVPPIYGPTADVSWQGADPTLPPGPAADKSPAPRGTQSPGGSTS